MAIQIGDSFEYKGAKPLDMRLKFDTLANMVAYPETALYDGILSYCVEDKTVYIFDSHYDEEVDTGRWRNFLNSADGSSFVTKKELENHTSMSSHITAAERLAWNAKANTASIPTKLEDLKDDTDQVTILNKFAEDEDGDLTYDDTEVITKISEEEGNQIEEKTDGLYVQPVEDEIETIAYSDFIALTDEEKGNKLRIVTGIPDETNPYVFAVDLNNLIDARLKELGLIE